MSYNIDYLKDARKDLRNFNNAEREQIFAAIEKFALNPLPKNEGGHGNPLGNKYGLNLTGLCKITLKKLGIRIVYKLIRTETALQILVIAARADEEVYKIAAKRNK